MSEIVRFLLARDKGRGAQGAPGGQGAWSDYGIDRFRAVTLRRAALPSSRKTSSSSAR